MCEEDMDTRPPLTTESEDWELGDMLSRLNDLLWGEYLLALRRYYDSQLQHLRVVHLPAEDVYYDRQGPYGPY